MPGHHHATSTSTSPPPNLSTSPTTPAAGRPLAAAAAGTTARAAAAAGSGVVRGAGGRLERGAGAGQGDALQLQLQVTSCHLRHCHLPPLHSTSSSPFPSIQTDRVIEGWRSIARSCSGIGVAGGRREGGEGGEGWEGDRPRPRAHQDRGRGGARPAGAPQARGEPADDGARRAAARAQHAGGRVCRRDAPLPGAARGEAAALAQLEKYEGELRKAA